MHCLWASGGLGSCFPIKGNEDLSISSSRNCLAAIACWQMISIWGEFCSNCEGIRDTPSPGKLLEECRVIGVNREIILSRFTGMVLPSRGTVPMHFEVIVETTVQTGQSNI